jgi:hypothetical protein
MESAAVSFEGLFEWNDDKERAVAQIAKNHLPLKILLKTKDDPVMLQGWISHHKEIVGLGGLIIMDNMSSDPKVSAIYADISNEAFVIRFSGFQDNVHRTDLFPELYGALRSSCSHFIFLDTDERLTLFDGRERFCADPSLITFLKDHSATKVFPGTWLQNVTGYSDRFLLYDPVIRLANGLKWGKPIISAACDPGGFINHNTQVKRDLYSEPIVTNLFVLHLSSVSNQQRLDSNLRKLRAAGAIPDTYGIAAILLSSADEWDHLPDTLKTYVQEITQINEEGLEFMGDIGGSFQIAADGLLVCNEEWQRRAIRNFVSDCSEFVSTLFST